MTESTWCATWRFSAAASSNQWRLLPAHSRHSSSVAVAVHSSSVGPTAAAAAAANPGRMFVFGTGFVGRHVSERLLRDGWEVSGTCTTAIKKKQLHKIGIDALAFDANQHKLRDLEALRDATHVLVSIPPALGIGDPLLNLHEDLHQLLNCGNLQWLCYLSSTSVYGDCGSALVDEDYPVNPRTNSAKSRYEAEKGWINFGLSLGLSTFIFRLGGIYGPGRSALDTLMKKKDLSEGQKRRDTREFYYTARVHVADICQAIFSSIENPCLGKIYNIVDDDPAPRAEVFAFARDLISRRNPELASDLNRVSSGDAQKLLIGEKRVSNLRMKKELGVQLIYPSYKSGLQSILDSG